MKTTIQPQLLSVKDVSTFTGLAVSTVWKYVKLDQFPKPHKLSMRVTRWKLSDIEQWIAEQVA